MPYKTHALRGISWIGGLSILTKAIGLIELIVLARILNPSDYGAYAIALLALGLLETITETGINIVLIQEEEIDKYISSAWILSIARGVLISVTLFLIAPLIVYFFNTPQALNLLYLISIVPAVRGFINPSIVKFQKNLMFGKNFLFRVTILLFDTLISVILTYLLKNPIGIILGLLSGVFLELLLSLTVVKPLPRLDFNKQHLSHIFHRGKWITGSTIFDYLFNNLDNVVVGRILGSSFLGAYQLAYSLAVMPLSEIGKVFVHVTVPIFVKISNDKNRLRNAFFKVTFTVFLISTPVLVVFLLIPQIFVIILGDKWKAITPILPILGAVGLLKSLSISSTSLFISLKKQKYTTIISFVSAFALMLSIVPLVISKGISGAGVAGLISVSVTIPLIVFFVVGVFKDTHHNSV